MDAVILNENDAIQLVEPFDNYKCLGFYVDKYRSNGVLEFTTEGAVVSRLLIQYRLKSTDIPLSQATFYKQFTPLQNGIQSNLLILKNLNLFDFHESQNIFQCQWNYPISQVNAVFCQLVMGDMLFWRDESRLEDFTDQADLAIIQQQFTSQLEQSLRTDIDLNF